MSNDSPQVVTDLIHRLQAAEELRDKLAEALLPLLKAQHEQAHRGDIFGDVRWIANTCDLCRPGRELLREARHADH